MKTYRDKTYQIARSIALILFLIGISLLASILYMHKTHKANSNCDEIKEVANTFQLIDEVKDPVVITARENITFILGEDREADNPYYDEATNYYRYNEKGKTEHVITSCRSLLEVRNYLAKNAPSNNQPWGLVNLVSHGNQWLGLSVRVVPEGKRSTPENIMESIDNSTFKPLPSYILDEESILYVHGCGIGNNPEILKSIGKAFGGKDTLPKVQASVLFEYYSSIKYNEVVIESQRYFAKVWHTNYKKGYRPENTVLSRRLKQEYPESTIDWQDALSREQPRWDGDIYHYTFEIPVKWVFPYPDKDSLPDLSSHPKQLEWIRYQDEIMETLKKIEIPEEKFNWWFRNVYVANEDGSRSPAIWLKGYSTILCVIQPVIEDENDNNIYMASLIDF